MNLFSRHKNTVVLAAVLLAQLLALAVQVKRQTAEGPVRVIRLVAVNTIAPVERLFIYTGQRVRGVWKNYLDLRGVRRENQLLKAETDRMRLAQAHELEEVRQAHRLQTLLGFKEHWIDTTVAAQVIGTSGMETSRLLYLDKGTDDGIRPDMPVITPDGVVGKVLTVYGDTSQVLMINDLTSGVGAILVNSRLQGIVKGTPTGDLQLSYIMSDETVKPGEALVTSGGDRVFPKGLPIGTVSHVSLGRDLFLDIRVKPAADLDRLEEVLVITRQEPRAPDADAQAGVSASDILSEHLPSVPQSEAAPAPQAAAVNPAPKAAAKPAPKVAPKVVPKVAAKDKGAAKAASSQAGRAKPKAAVSEGAHPQ
jgi:rod shape-determining protein MreC